MIFENWLPSLTTTTSFYVCHWNAVKENASILNCALSILFCTELYCIKLYLIAQNCTAYVQHVSVRGCSLEVHKVKTISVLFCMELYFTVLTVFTVLFWIFCVHPVSIRGCSLEVHEVKTLSVLFCMELYFTVLYCTVLFCSVLY